MDWITKNKYYRWLGASLAKMNADFLNGSFKPQNEYDIRAHLYHNLLETKSHINELINRHFVLTEHHPVSTTQEACDLALVRYINDMFEPRVFIEIEKTSKSHRTAESVETEKIADEIEKLKKYNEVLTERYKGYKIPVIVFYFYKADIHGISVKTHREMKKLQAKLQPDINFWWGPVG